VSKDDPAAWLVANADMIPTGAEVLDVACGSGRNTMFLAERGCRVHAVDRDAAALEHLGTLARTRGLAVTTECCDLAASGVSLGVERFDAAIVFNYLHRPLLPAVVNAIRKGGVLIYETFTIAQATRGRPRNPAFLLQPGELFTIVAPMRVARSREGDFDGRFVASIVALR
jgi:SAM-dependent methyltransferase